MPTRDQEQMEFAITPGCFMGGNELVSTLAVVSLTL